MLFLGSPACRSDSVKWAEIHAGGGWVNANGRRLQVDRFALRTSHLANVCVMTSAGRKLSPKVFGLSFLLCHPAPPTQAQGIEGSPKELDLLQLIHSFPVLFVS